MARIYDQKAVKPSQNKKAGPSEKKDEGTKKGVEKKEGEGGVTPCPLIERGMQHGK